jgi:hypothetical protein
MSRCLLAKAVFVGIQHVELSVHDGDAFGQCSSELSYRFQSGREDRVMNGWERIVR